MIQIKMTTPTGIKMTLRNSVRNRMHDSAHDTITRLLRGTVVPLLALLAASLTAPASAQVQQLPTIELSAGMHRIEAEVAGNAAQRQIGLMNRPNMPANHGMLFVFEGPDVHCFWMRNTLLLLSIAFLAPDGRIVNIEDMAPQTETSHCPREPVRYALEMNQGWFAKRGFKAGDKVGGAPFAK